MELQEAMERARAAAYEPSAAVDWDLVEFAGAGVGEDSEAGIVASYLDHHLPRWYRALTLEGAAPWTKLEARILAQPVLPIPTAERNDADSMRSACAVWRTMLDALDTQDEEARWRGWLCAWVLGWEDPHSLAAFALKTVQYKAWGARFSWPNNTVKSIIINNQYLLGIDASIRLWGGKSNIFHSVYGEGPLVFNAENSPFSPLKVAQAAQQCLIRIPDRIVARFALRRWQTSLGFEV